MPSSGPADAGQPETAYVWIWLPDATEPVPAGRLDQIGKTVVYRYGRSYLERADRIAIYEPELPLVAGEQVPRADVIHGSIADAGPDSWGQRVRLAQLASLNVPEVGITEVLGKKVMLVERFDRGPRGRRRAMVSALTILGLGQAGGRYASFAELARLIRARFTDPDATLRELFSRITLNILVSNTDDHARNQAAFWDGRELTLTPAYDICPYPRSGGEAEQVMAIGEDGWRHSQLAGCVARAATYHLSTAQAQEIVDHQVDVIESRWTEVCDDAGLTQVQRSAFWERQFLNPFAFLDSHT